ncbi:hypothetical protein GCM10011529_30010 [Polymorphobacter glacialis]|uniref:Uncharacterized protein n=1 Tax=Sandarakinorhabdus glacialis TaxID=1614636 RepID=A0A917A0S5_9SPHN|nr:hypothetical protein [Polymorphobacter glacialis]GGE21388.1 hypothetical protein GCM10011529_30010 [Polymorphobacter glacialis]
MIDHPATTSAVERVARVLAAWRLSLNAGGVDPSASPEVEAEWPNRIEQAMAVLRVLREPDAAMAAVGDVAVWSRMVEAAIASEEPPAVAPPTPEVRDAGDPSHDGPWSRRDQAMDESFPASDPAPLNPGVD